MASSSLGFWIVSATLLGQFAQGGASREVATISAFADVKQIVGRHFASRAGFQHGDLVSRGDVEPLFAKLEKSGWRVEDRTAILASTLPDNDFLVTLLRSPKGQTIMRFVSKEQISFELMDQMAQRKDGRQLLKDSVQSNEGRHLIDFAARTQRGRELQIEKANPPIGRDVARLAGRIYTVEQLLQRLEASYLKAAR